MHRSKCYKGDPPNPNDPDQISPVEFAQTRAAIKNYNQYIADKPLMDAYAKDTLKDPMKTASGLQGTAGADLAQKNAGVYKGLNPNAGLPSFTRGAVLGGKVMGDLSRDAVGQRAAATNGILQNKLGLQSSTNTAQEGMAKDAVSRNLAENEANFNSGQATTQAMVSGAGAVASVPYTSTKK